MNNTDISEIFGNVLNQLKGVRKIVPVNIRQYAGTILGDRSPLTEDDLWGSDIEAIKNAVIRNKKGEGTGFVQPGVIGYGDYGEKDGDFSDWQGGSKNGVGPFAALLKSYIDPKFRMETTLGMAKYADDGSGNTVVQDTYNFGATPEQIKTEIDKYGGKFKAVKGAYQNAGFEGLLNAIGNLYAAPEGNNSGPPVRINLGKVE